MNLPLRMMVLSLVFVALSLIGGVAMAQTETPTPSRPDAELPFQVIEVENFAYRVDPYYPCVMVLRERTTRLAPEEGPISALDMVLFVRDRAGQMQHVDLPFPMSENELTAEAEVGQSFVCDVQVPVDAEALDG